MKYHKVALFPTLATEMLPRKTLSLCLARFSYPRSLYFFFKETCKYKCSHSSVKHFQGMSTLPNADKQRHYLYLRQVQGSLNASQAAPQMLRSRLSQAARCSQAAPNNQKNSFKLLPHGNVQYKPTHRSGKD